MYTMSYICNRTDLAFVKLTTTTTHIICYKALHWRDVHNKVECVFYKTTSYVIAKFIDAVIGNDVDGKKW